MRASIRLMRSLLALLVACAFIGAHPLPLIAAPAIRTTVLRAMPAPVGQGLKLVASRDSVLMGEAVKLTVQLPAQPPTTWRRIVMREIPATGVGQQSAMNRPVTCSVSNSRPCTTQVLGDRAASYQFMAEVFDKKGHRRAASVATVRWSPWQVDLTTRDGASTGANQVTVHPTQNVTLASHIHATAHDPDFHVSIQSTDGSNSPIASGDACVDALDCTFTVQAQQTPATLRAVVVVDGKLLRPLHDALGSSAPLTITWANTCGGALQRGSSIPDQNPGCRSLAATLTASATKVGAGAAVDLTAQADLSGSPFHMVIADDTGTQHPCAAGQTPCTWSVTQPAPGSRSYTTWIQDPDGKKAGPVSPSLAVVWDAWKIVSVQPPTQTVTAGHAAAVTATANYPLPTGYSIHLTEDSGASFSCASGTTCTWNVTETSPGTHTFAAAVFDASGAKVDVSTDASAQVTWQATWTGNVSLSADGASAPVGVNVTLTATASADVSGTGFTIVISADTSDSQKCASGTICIWKVTSATAVTHTFTAAVVDSSGKNAAVAPTALAISWTNWNVSLSADQTQAPVGTPINLTENVGYDVSGTGLTMVIQVDTGNSNTCTTGKMCTWQLVSNMAGSHTVTAYVVDAQNHVVAQSSPLTLTWIPQNWTIQLSVDTTSPPSGQPVNFTATVGQDWSKTGYVLKLRRDNGTGFVMDTCSSPQTGSPSWSCAFQVNYQLLPGEPDAFRRNYVASLEVPNGQVIAVSNVVTVDWSSNG